MPGSRSWTSEIRKNRALAQFAQPDYKPPIHFSPFLRACEDAISKSWQPAELLQPLRCQVESVAIANGGIKNIKIKRASKNSDYDSSCVRAVEHVKQLGSLPAGVSSTSLFFYFCYAPPMSETGAYSHVFANTSSDAPARGVQVRMKVTAGDPVSRRPTDFDKEELKYLREMVAACWDSWGRRTGISRRPVVLSIRFNSSGVVDNIKLEESSGDERLDNSVATVISPAYARFEPLPELWRESLTVRCLVWPGHSFQTE